MHLSDAERQRVRILIANLDRNEGYGDDAETLDFVLDHSLVESEIDVADDLYLAPCG